MLPRTHLAGKVECNEMSLKDDKMLAAGEGGSLSLPKHTSVRGDVGTRITLAVHLLTTQSHTRGEFKDVIWIAGSN